MGVLEVLALFGLAGVSLRELAASSARQMPRMWPGLVLESLAAFDRLFCLWVSASC
jgi:hypothetical protein